MDVASGFAENLLVFSENTVRVHVYGYVKLYIFYFNAFMVEYKFLKYC